MEPATDSAATGSAELGLRERKKQETRRVLERRALELAAERGFEHVTVEGIAAAAGVSTRTFFNYFASKEDAAFGTVKGDPYGDFGEESERVFADLREQPADVPPLAALCRVLCSLAGEMSTADERLWRLRFELMNEHPQLVMRMVSSFERWERVLAQAIAERTGTDVDRDAYPSLVVSVAIGALRASLIRWLATDSSQPLEEHIREAFDLLATGLAPPYPLGQGNSH